MPTSTGWIRSIPTTDCAARPAPAAAKTRPGPRIPAPARRPPRRTPARRPATAGPSPPTASPDPNTRTPCPARSAPSWAADHAGRRLAGRQRPQPRHRLGAVTRAHRGEPGVPGPVMVERVGHIGQRHLGAGAVHPVGQHRRRRGHPLRRLTRDHQRRSPPDRVRAATGTGSGACSITTCAFVPLTPNDDTPARRGRPVGRPFHALGGDGQRAAKPVTGIRSQLVEVQVAAECSRAARPARS